MTFVPTNRDCSMKTSQATFYGLFCFGPLGIVTYAISSFVMVGLMSIGMPGIMSEALLLLTIALGGLAVAAYLVCPFLLYFQARQGGATRRSEASIGMVVIMLLHPAASIHYFWENIMPLTEAPEAVKGASPPSTDGAGKPIRLGWVTFAPMSAYIAAFGLMFLGFAMHLNFVILSLSLVMVVVGVVLAMLRLTKMLMHLHTNGRVSPQARRFWTIALYLGAGIAALAYWAFSLSGGKAKR